jgi:hypothetical protein
MEEWEVRNEIQSKNQKKNLGDRIDLGKISVMMRWCTDRAQNRGRCRALADITMDLPVPYTKIDYVCVHMCVHRQSKYRLQLVTSLSKAYGYLHQQISPGDQKPYSNQRSRWFHCRFWNLVSTLCVSQYLSRPSQINPLGGVRYAFLHCRLVWAHGSGLLTCLALVMKVRLNKHVSTLRKVLKCRHMRFTNSIPQILT